jgi:hypothetical protein
MTIYFQYCDPLIDVLNYIVQVRQPGHDFPRLLYLPGSKEMPPGLYSRGNHSRCP